MAMLSDSIRGRVAHQLDALDFVLQGAEPAFMTARPPSGKWSAHEHIAHLARVHALLLERIDTILREDRPPLTRYRAENDPEWPSWAQLPTAVATTRLRDSRAALARKIDAMTAADLARVGLHPAFGPLTIPGWLEFFMLHEAHHLYQVLVRIAEARVQAAKATGA
jgi:uncharacterized damage-inducible protein DinB